MRVLLIGATGRTGLLVLKDLLSRGHTVTALVRDPSKLEPQPNLYIVRGTLTSTDINAAIITSPSPISAVIVTLNAPRASDSPFAKPLAPPRMMTDAHAALCEAMAQRGIKRIVTMSAFGVGSSRGNVNWAVNLVLRKTNMKAQFEDHDAVDEEMRARAGVEWTLVRPVMLAEGGKAEIKVCGDEGEGVGWLDRISRESVAGFLVDCAEGEEWVGGSPVIKN
ncbi:MAG: hypothetical protein MMC23_007975 [Stictis urceolatum]|nr:hypothetical protein [Stictis urceolata]